MSYVRGGDDESLHEKHHAKVTRGSIWDGLGRGRARKKTENGIGIGIGEKDCGWRILKDNVPFGPGGKGKGKVIVADGSYGGAKVCIRLSSSHPICQSCQDDHMYCNYREHQPDDQLDDILKTVDTVLSSPPLPSAIMAQCKIFLFTTSSPAPSRRLQPRTTSDRTPKERVVAIVVSQPIKWAMKLIGNTKAKVSDQTQLPPGETVDSGDGVLCEYVIPLNHCDGRTDELVLLPSRLHLGFIDYSLFRPIVL
jgi:N-acetyltransferase